MIDKLIADVRRLASEKPDNIYESDYQKACSYISGKTTDGECGCLFGQAAKNQPELYQYMTTNNTSPIKTILAYFGKFSEEKTNWCRIVQRLQDNRCPWDECIKQADEKMSRFRI